MRKRLTALIMAVLMLLQLLPASVVAETTDEIISDVLTAPESHTVSFWVNGEKIKTVFVQDGSALGLLPDAPEYENLQFDGWYAGNELLTTDYIVSADLTVEAVYTEIAPQTIERTFEFDSLTLTGFVPESVIVDAEDVFEKYADYMKNESVVAAWNISAGQNDEYPLAAAFKVSSSVKDSIWKAWKVLTDGTCEELKADIQEGALRFDVTKSGIYLVTESIPENVLRTTDGATYDISVRFSG